MLGAWYHATKHALEGWSDSLRLELEPFGIRVVIVEPGLIETGFGDAAGRGMLERSGAGPYAKLAEGVVKSMQASYGQNRGSNPDIAYHFAAALKQAGQKEEARALLTKMMASNAPFDEKANAQKLLDELSKG